MTTNTHDDRIAMRLTSLPAAIRDAGFEPNDYRLLRDAAINGRIAAHQRSGIWHFFAEDTADIAAALRLPRLRTVSPKPGRRTQTIAA